ncbi:MAG: hypothetical protein P8X65_13470 [Syntrophobacterales bacterium]|jgi:hypothetical protein
MNRQESKTLLPKKIEILKESLDSGFKIRVHDLVMDEARVLFDQLTTEFSAMSNNPFN